MNTYFTATKEVVFSSALFRFYLFVSRCEIKDKLILRWIKAEVRNRKRSKSGTKKYTVFQKNPCDYVFEDNLNSKRPIVIIFGTVIT